METDAHAQHTFLAVWSRQSPTKYVRCDRFPNTGLIIALSSIRDKVGPRWNGPGLRKGVIAFTICPLKD